MIWVAMILLVAGTALTFGAHGAGLHFAGVVGALLGVLLILTWLWRLRHRSRYDDRLETRVTANYRTSRKKIVAMIAVVIYLISPVDIAVLALVLPVGVVSDAGATAWLLLATGKELSRHHRSRKLRRTHPPHLTTGPRPRP
jgi:uncharacterized membrane protein YkvA (DUF1232 family)